MVICTECGAQGRVGNVDENDPQGVRVTYLCPNNRCGHYKQDIGEEILKAEERKK